MKVNINKCNKCLKIVINTREYSGTVFVFALLSEIISDSLVFHSKMMHQEPSGIFKQLTFLFFLLL